MQGSCARAGCVASVWRRSKTTTQAPRSLSSRLTPQSRNLPSALYPTGQESPSTGDQRKRRHRKELPAGGGFRSCRRQHFIGDTPDRQSNDQADRARSRSL